MMHLHPNIRDRLIHHFYQNSMISTTAPTLTTPAQTALNVKEYTRRVSPETCPHDGGTHVYGAGHAGTLAICQKCGMRWQKSIQNQAVHWRPVQPKAGPAARTPLVARESPDGQSASSWHGSPSRSAGAPSKPPTRSGSRRPISHLIGTPPYGPRRMDSDAMSVTTIITGLAEEEWADYAEAEEPEEPEPDASSVATMESEVPDS